jgi:uncharacterized protein YpmB
MNMTTNTKNTQLMIFFILLVVVSAAFTMFFWLLTPMPAQAAAPSVTNFICQIQGKWSNEHYDVRSAVHQGDGIWELTYRDSGLTTVYVQRHGEDCSSETFPVSQVK